MQASSLTSPSCPGRRIWRSDQGRWWATRTSPFSRAAERAEAHRTVDADDERTLRELIAEQEHRARAVS
ncbi:hypothetical protein FHR32_004375 [Streptosporangium album]|uniref:Uncharacterized protein n=1 Tax=Streptosporangium album TaxID=47479 RepID=A0A7W7RXQ4_9ACTN|nr:hypothetical protein [Streptosporangium album]MBB4940070.1 hypothetical protein [Streptosporangium album]